MTGCLVAFDPKIEAICWIVAWWHRAASDHVALAAMSDALVLSFRRCGFSLAEQSVQIKLQLLLESLHVDTAWIANHYEVFLSYRCPFLRSEKLSH